MLKLYRDELDALDAPWAYADGSRAGKRSLTQGLAPRALVFRVDSAEAAHALGAAFGPRDGNGVAAGADAAVARATTSRGAPLRDDLRARFEASLGADLSGVRVHTDAGSAEASAAVGAKAYTVGTDIHFGADHYRPDDPFGMHLLAHEVAHTVQQAGAAPHRQHKLEVSTPGDAAEVEADRAADAMVAGASIRVAGSAPSAVARKDDDKCTDPKSAATAADRLAATNAIAEAETDSEDAVSRFEQWSIIEMTNFITRTATSPGEDFNPGTLKAILGLGVGKGVGAAGGAVSGAVSQLGLPGKLAGAAISALADALAGSLKESIEGGKDPSKKEAAAARAAAIRDQQIPAIRAAFKSGDSKRKAIRDASQRARHKLLDQVTRGDTDALCEWADGEIAHAKGLKFTEGALWQPMLDRWVGAHANDPESPADVDSVLWKQACKDLYGVENMPRADYWRYPLRIEWDAMGLDGDQAFSIPAAASGNASGSKVFTVARDPAKLAARWGGAKDSPRYQHLASGGGFKLTSTFLTAMTHSVHLDLRKNERYVELKGTSYMLDLLGLVDGDGGEMTPSLPRTQYPPEAMPPSDDS